MKTIEKIDNYITEREPQITLPDPIKKQTFDDYKKLQKEAKDFLKNIKTDLKNHQNRFFSAPDFSYKTYRDELEDVVDDLRRISRNLKSKI